MFIECEFGSGEDHPTPPEGSFDWAFPIDWILDVQKVLGEDYKPLGGHIVWHYPERSIFGHPVGLCLEAQRLLDLYQERRNRNPL